MANLRQHPDRRRIEDLRRRVEVRRLLALRARRAFNHLAYAVSGLGRVILLGAGSAFLHLADLCFEFEKTFGERRRDVAAREEVACIQPARY